MQREQREQKFCRSKFLQALTGKGDRKYTLISNIHQCCIRNSRISVV